MIGYRKGVHTITLAGRGQILIFGETVEKAVLSMDVEMGKIEGHATSLADRAGAG